MIELILSLPGWVLSAIVGAILGAIGGLIAQPLMKRGQKWATVIPIALIAGGFGITNQFVMPALLASEAALCPIAKAGADAAARDGAAKPQVDQVTRFDSTIADCAQKTVVTRYTVSVPRASIEEAGLADIERDFSAENCRDPYGRRLLAAGWSIENIFEFADGDPIVLTAAC